MGGTPTSLKVKETLSADIDLPLPTGRARPRSRQGPQVHLRTLSRAGTASPPSSKPACTQATPVSPDPRGPAVSSPAIACQGTPGEHRQRGAGAEKGHGRRAREDPAHLPHLPTWGSLSGQQLRVGSLRAVSLAPPSCSQRAWVPAGPCHAEAAPECARQGGRV